MFERTYIDDAKKRLEKTVTIAGWVSRTRDLGKITFVILRDRTGDIQITVKPEQLDASDLEKFRELGREDIIAVKGNAVVSKIVKAGVEFIPLEHAGVEIINKSKQPLPFDLFGQVKAELDTRLNYRFMDFRTHHTSAIFKIQHQLLTSFRRFLTDRGYIEIQPPCVIASASEGGADLFRLPYFEKEAFLAQSPQLYKQMCAISFEKVFTVVPIWRAEKFNTPTHLNEVRQMDIEQAFADDEVVMKVLEEVLGHMLSKVKERCSGEFDILGREIVVPELPLRRLTYTEAVETLQDAGEWMEWGDDFSKAQERRLWELVGEEAFFVKDWPAVQKAFYAMPYSYEEQIIYELQKYLPNINSRILNKNWGELTNSEKLLLLSGVNKIISKKGVEPLSIHNFENVATNLDAIKIALGLKPLEIVHAFDLLYNGVEISSGTQRVHKPDLLREQLRKKGLEPDDFTYYIESFSYGAPPHAGWSIGLERLTMTVTGMNNIRECCMFPRDRDRLVP
jgi:nondiscriminating aspartyl-tRNA synthetase